ncbi:hypothetical protein PROFUN_10729 [Planoprotostelium fungivorum]|uniref:PH domain-containing protein n=1 Tax=Planoprotostelium fungivorum TaxID=1890364 RepID=A0A2P6N7W4_9EUKA|nr:hypothetical protein PROFUN_10729 [Planoprotostelium fungivorum]
MKVGMMTVKIRPKFLSSKIVVCRKASSSNKAEMVSNVMETSETSTGESGFLQLKMLNSAEWTNKYVVIPKGQWPVLWLFDKAVEMSKITSEEKSGKVYPLRSSFVCPIDTARFKRDHVFYLTDNATFFFFLQASCQTNYKAWLQVLTDNNVVDVSRAEFKMVESTLSVITALVDERCNMYIGTINLRGLQHGEGGYLIYANGDTYKGEFANDKRHGIGCWQTKGKTIEGIFVDDELVEEKSEKEISAEQPEEENERLRQAIETRDLLQAMVVDAEQRLERESKMVKEEMERLREEGREMKRKLDEEYRGKLVKVQRRMEESRRQDEEKLKEAQRRVQVVTGGLNWDTYCQVNLKKAEERQREEEEECIVCFDAPQRHGKGCWQTKGKTIEGIFVDDELVEEEKSKKEISAEQPEEENRRLRQAIETRDLLQAMEQRVERESKIVKKEMERLKEELEEKREEGREMKRKLDEEYRGKLVKVQRRMEESRRQDEEKLKEAQRRVQVVTGGLNWDTYCQVNLKKAEERQREEEEECIVCFDAPPQVTLPCRHKNMCEVCYMQIKSSGKADTRIEEEIEWTFSPSKTFHHLRVSTNGSKAARPP